MQRNFSFTTLCEALGPDFDPPSMIGMQSHVLEPGSDRPFPALIVSISIVGTDTKPLGATFELLYDDFGPPVRQDLIV